MAAFLIIEVMQVIDQDTYAKYIEKAEVIITKYGGRYLTRGKTIIPLKGQWSPKKIVIIEFINIEHLQKCFQSDEYLEIAL